MRDRYFHMYCIIKYKECFYNVHQARAQKLYNTYAVVMGAISIASVAAWSISKDLPALWAILIALAQFAQAFSGNLPCAQQIAALKYLVPELAKLSLEIDNSWRDIDLCEFSDTEISDLITEYEQRFSALEMQFANGIEFSQSKSILRKTEHNQRAYFYARYLETEGQA